MTVQGPSTIDPFGSRSRLGSTGYVPLCDRRRDRLPGSAHAVFLSICGELSAVSRGATHMDLCALSFRPTCTGWRRRAGAQPGLAYRYSRLGLIDLRRRMMSLTPCRTRVDVRRLKCALRCALHRRRGGRATPALTSAFRRADGLSLAHSGHQILCLFRPADKRDAEPMLFAVNRLRDGALFWRASLRHPLLPAASRRLVEQNHCPRALGRCPIVRRLNRSLRR